MRATLRQLLTNDELNKLAYSGFNFAWDMELCNVSMNVLTDIAIMLIRTEYGDVMPSCVLSAKAIEILTHRAIEKKLEIF